MIARAREPLSPSPLRFRGALLALGLAAFAPAVAARAQAPASPDSPAPDGPRGPLPIRDGQLLSQPRLTLPATSPTPVPGGHWSLDLSVLWTNSFAWTQDAPGETPSDRSFLIDGESVNADATVRRGLRDDLDVGLRLPLQHRGGGILDAFIDAWHRIFHLPDGNRPDFLRDAFRVEGRTTDGRPFSWNDRAGTGLGDLELDVRWRARDGGPSSASLALIGRLSLPTGTAPFDGNGVGAAGQLLLAAPLSPRLDLYAGAGATVQEPGPVDGVEYVPARAHGFVALEWRPWRRVSLLAQTNAASRLVRNIDLYPGLHWVVNVGGRIDLGARTRLDVGLTENIADQQSTPDLAFYFALGLRR
jgi:hypothetical protein